MFPQCVFIPFHRVLDAVVGERGRKAAEVSVTLPEERDQNRLITDGPQRIHKSP
jgi:hypothetical protein